MTAPTTLPEFGNPPLVEVAISVQFQGLQKFGIVHVGGLWEIFRERMPIVEYQPPLPPLFEIFNLGDQAAIQVPIHFFAQPTLPRIWFRDSANSKLIQIQSDKLILNWQKTNNNTTYPRYSVLRGEFSETLNSFVDFLTSNNIGSLVPNQCEITYVNLLRTKDVNFPIGIFKKIELSSVGPFAAFEDATVSARYRMSDADGNPTGRLNIVSVPGVDSSGEPVNQLTLTGRGPPKIPTLEAVFEFIDKAHIAVVNAFADITPEDLHRVWERRK